MDISQVESLKELMEKVRESEAALPPYPVIEDLPPLPGLDAFETDMMFVRLLEQVGLRLGIELDGLGGIATSEELLRKITNGDVANMLRAEFQRLGVKRADRRLSQSCCYFS